MTSEALLNSRDASSADPASSNAFRKIMVAHDGSAASDRALADAADLARRLHAELFIACVESPEDTRADGPRAHREPQFSEENYEGDATELIAPVHTLVAKGAVQTTLLRFCEDKQIDLLLLGAYGHGPQDRLTLGSTAERLLRTVRCPCVVYGPKASGRVFSNAHAGPALLPVSLPCSESDMLEAITIAKAFGASVEIYHSVVHREAPHELRWCERECKTVAALLRREGIRTEWSFLYGDPAASICCKSTEIHSPFVLMPLKPRGTLSLPTSDNVAAGVIRRSTVPVLTYRCR